MNPLLLIGGGYVAYKLLQQHSYGDPESALQRWGEALGTNDVETVVANYQRHMGSAPIPALWGTFSENLESGIGAIRQYFIDLFADHPGITVDFKSLDSKQLMGDVAVLSGSYVFNSPKAGAVPARYTFVVRKCPKSGTWRIVTHHSSIFAE